MGTAVAGGPAPRRRRSGPGTAPAPPSAARPTGSRGRFEALGYDVRRQSFDVPGGVSWGVPVEPGARSTWSPRRRTSTRPAAPGRRRPPRHGPPGTRRGGQRLGGRCAARGGRGGRGPPYPAAGGARRVRRRGAPRAERRRPPLRVARLRRPAWVRRSGRALRGMVSLDRVGVGDVRAGLQCRGDPGPAPRPSCWPRRARAGVADAAVHRQPGQRPLVVRPRRAARRAPGQHAVRRLPQRRRRPGGRRTGAQLGRAARIAVAWLSGTPERARSRPTTRRPGSLPPPRARPGAGERRRPSGRARARSPSAGRPSTSPRASRPAGSRS